MKVLAINGSPKKEGNTYHALTMLGKQLEKENIDFEILHIGNKAIQGCLGCGKCYKMKNNQCGITTDIVNESIPKILEADGIVLGSPVHFSGISGTMKSFLDRVWYVSSSNNNSLFHHKVGAAVVAVRRSGGSATLDSLYHYLAYSEMILATSNYWNIIHGTTPAEAEQDTEGVQIMETLGNNMAWIMKMKEASATLSLEEPEIPNKIMMNFIR
ncbi:flavodoxin family protein [Plebeiibacterium marinum]|uniref:Flavodoxin family protein n=1 Tax=Plebeiibacterium marinum TaxID=2992111 RepID=A0AAE3MG28_9BACT|nr:flavodoxin family protein [Plebeiobacterium marinum]MCW3806806.1 flavodoxin family protein [Plebeiobacterium marinum]